MTRAAAQAETAPAATDAPAGSPLSVGRFHAYRTQTVKNLPFWSPCLIWVQAGTKFLAIHEQSSLAHAGDLLLIPAGVRCQLENRPDVHLGEYRAVAFELSASDAELIATQLHLNLAPAPCALRFAQCSPSEELVQSLHHLQDSIAGNSHPTIARHRLREVLLQWVIQDREIWPLLFPRTRSLTMQVQTIIAEDPVSDWTLERLSQRLHRSVATLSRQLKEEQSGLRAILDDVRLVRAFNLLQTTHASVDHVAQACGYQSTPRFSERFRGYFGLSPAQLRKTRQQITASRKPE